MKTFSVGFFKRAILVVLALLILIPTTLAIYFGVKCSRLEQRLIGQGNVGEPARQTAPTQTMPARAEGSAVPRPTGTAPAEAAPEKGEALDYQELYPDLYGTAQIAEQRVRASDTVYLTFDGSPSANTRRILDVLDEYGIKATFFVMGHDDEASLATLKEISDRGHSIGLRCYSNSFQEIYASIEAYLTDFKKIYDLVYETTGQRAEIFRFPGGSVNGYNSGFYQELIAEMLRRNFIYFDWNVAGESTQSDGLSAQRVKDNVLGNMAHKDRAIIMFQDSFGKEAVVDALPDIIEGLQDKGYGFQPLTAAVLPIVYSYKSAP